MGVGLVIRTFTRLVDTLTRSLNVLQKNVPIKICTLLALTIGAVTGSFWGLSGIAIGMQAGLIVGLCLSCRLMLSLLNMRLRDFAAGLLPIFAFIVLFVMLGSTIRLLAPATSSIVLQTAAVLGVCLATSILTFVLFRSRFSGYFEVLRSLRPMARTPET
jgi:hypothetical protein